MNNYFELFEIDPNYRVDSSLIEEKYLDLQKRYHPDNFTEVDEQIKAMEMVMLINQAYEVFTNNNRLLEYYLDIKGFRLSQGEIKHLLPKSDLMYMFELKSSLRTKGYIRQELKAKVKSIRLRLIEFIKENNHRDIKVNLARLIFFNNSLQNIG
ncbi:MAG: DnaJ domain-containing protein [Proteobacteria bacterium]|nr:DnaJ domain-containing protein [Pseudomonadota bacterium]